MFKKIFPNVIVNVTKPYFNSTLGFTYDFIELFTGYYLPLDDTEKTKFLEVLDENERLEFLKNKEACEKIHNKNKHKLVGIVNL